MKRIPKGGCQALRVKKNAGHSAPIKLVNPIQRLAAALADGPQVEMNVTHLFTHDADGNVNLYTRGCLMRAGSIVISKKHKTEHPYFILKGSGHVYIEGQGWKPFRAPASGVTKPGTVRALWIEEDTVWVTSHPTNTSDLEKIESQVIDPTDIPAPLVQKAMKDIQLLLQ